MTLREQTMKAISAILQSSTNSMLFQYEMYPLARFVFVMFSATIAALGTVGNLLLVYIFVTRRYPNTPPTLYPLILAMLDTLMCTLYILLFGVDAAVVFLHVESLFVLYYSYIVPAFVLSRMTQLAIPYMLIFATLERFVWINPSGHAVLQKMYSTRGRYVTVGVTLFVCACLRLPTAWATKVFEHESCPDFFRTKTTGAAEWVGESFVYHILDFHFLSIVQTVVPFFVLLTFNVIIVRKLTTAKANCSDVPIGHYSPKCQTSPTDSLPTAALVQKSSLRRQMSTSLKSAVYTMVAIVTSYIFSNSLHLCLTVLERSDSTLLKHPTDPELASTFHTTFSDVVSFVYMFTSAIRILIYYQCNTAIRNDLRDMFISWFTGYDKKEIVMV
uniref:G_PROTEIN_RECEP_F1_2 domain-containing protein n=1 Tax=Steinernema glaseri TaxID=37863 RepID=A0A1I7YS46_9BILA